MRKVIPVLATVTALGCSAAPALAMPADPVTRPTSPQPAAPAVSATPPAGDDSTLVAVLVGSGALLAGTGLGFTAARVRLRPGRLSAT